MDWSSNSTMYMQISRDGPPAVILVVLKRLFYFLGVGIMGRTNS